MRKIDVKKKVFTPVLFFFVRSGCVQAREQQELARLGEVMTLVTASTCQSQLLMHHFGEDVDSDTWSCDHLCHFCRTGQALELSPQSAGLKVDPKLWRALLEDPRIPTFDPVRLARFAMGYKSPQLAQLSKHALFGCLLGCNYDEVLELCQKVCGRDASAIF